MIENERMVNATKRKLLFINGHLNVGGVEKSLVDILKHINYELFDVDLLLLEGLGDYQEEIPPQVNIILKDITGTYGSIIRCIFQSVIKGDWFTIRMRLIFLMMKLSDQKAIRLAKGLLTNNVQYDCVIGFRSGICSQIAAYAVNAKKKILWWHHGEINVDVNEYSKTVEACNFLVAVSKSCGEMLLKNLKIEAEKIVVLCNMIDEENLKQKALENNPYSTHSKHLVTVCRISEEKHVENVVYAAQELKKKGYDFCWHIVGDGILKEGLVQLAENLNVADCVVFEGRKTNPYPYMKYADLYVHPSYVESQGLTILEAMALGIPCVVTKSLGPCEFIQDGVNGILTSHNPESLTEKVWEILTDTKLYQCIKKNTRCPEQFTPEIVMGKFTELLEENL